MITRLKTLAVVVGCLATAMACDEDDNESKRSLASTDKTFVEGAALSNMTEIEFGTLAATRGNSEMVRDYGEQMVSEHTMAQNSLRILGNAYENVDFPESLDAQHQQIRQQLMDMSGYSFDSMYISSQINDHQMTLDMFESELASGVEEPVRNYAAKYRPNIEMHLEKADSIMTVLLANPE
jgi:putative membrane protein